MHYYTNHFKYLHHKTQRTVSTSILSSERDVRETTLHRICLPKLLVVHNANVLIWATYVFQTEAIRKLQSKLYHCFCKLNACYRTLLQHIYYLVSYGEWHHLLHLKICHLLSVLKQVLTTSRHAVQTLESLQHNEAALHIHPVTKWWQIIIKLQLHF